MSELSNAQAAAVDKAVAWFKGGASTPQVFRIFGYAGTGKTHTARKIESILQVPTAYCAYTGKAASVLGNGASTIHSLIYRVGEGDRDLISLLQEKMKDASPSLLQVLKKDLAEATRPRFQLRPLEEIPYKLIVCDEVSMVGEDVGKDLASFGIKILVLGDPGQLPPISGAGYFDSAEPDVLLTEIHRQARGNPIISMATLVRQGHRLRLGDYGSSKVVDRRKDSIDPRLFSQVIVGTNRSRGAWNSRYRELVGSTSAEPNAGEKVICLRNNAERGLLNGTQWRVHSGADNGLWFTLKISSWSDEWDENFPDSAMQVDCHPFGKDLKDEPAWVRRAYEEFDFGYAITCHKAQGSQWDKLFLVDESWIFKETAKRWLYTGLTRAVNTVVVQI